MEYCISEIQYDQSLKNNAAVKAREDISRILCHMGAKTITLYDIERRCLSLPAKAAEHVRVAGMWKRAFSKLRESDVLYVQFPPVLHTLFYANCIDSLKKRGVKVILIIHDLELFRWKKRKDATWAKKIRFDAEEKSVLLRADGIIAHNEKMKCLLTDLGADPEKIVCLDIFDYLIPGYSRKVKSIGSNRGSVLIAGNLARHKAGYVYKLPTDIHFVLYGTNFEGSDAENVCYRGSVPPEELPFCLNGSFGLVWDGESAETCKGVYGEYLSCNNPHKTSLYLASGIPVIIWNGAALSDFVKRENCGITASSLYEIGPLISSMTSEEYAVLRSNAERVGHLLRSGAMTEKAVKALRGNRSVSPSYGI